MAARTSAAGPDARLGQQGLQAQEECAPGKADVGDAARIKAGGWWRREARGWWLEELERHVQAGRVSTALICFLRAMESWPEAVDSAGVTRVMRLLACARRADCADMALQALLASDLRVSLRRKETVSPKEAVSSASTQVPGAHVRACLARAGPPRPMHNTCRPGGVSAAGEGEEQACAAAQGGSAGNSSKACANSSALPADRPPMSESRSQSGDGRSESGDARQAGAAARGGRGGVRVVEEDEVLLWVKCVLVAVSLAHAGLLCCCGAPCECCSLRMYSISS